MRRWSGSWFGLAVLFLCAGLTLACVRWFSISSTVKELGIPFVPAADMYYVTDEVVQAALVGAVGGAVFAAIGLILWIRESRAARRVDAGRVFE